MHLFGRDKLESLRGRERATDLWMSAWLSEVCHAAWAGPGDVLTQFPKALEIGSGKYRFSVSSGLHVIEVFVSFPQKVVLITGLVNIEDANGY